MIACRPISMGGILPAVGLNGLVFAAILRLLVRLVCPMSYAYDARWTIYHEYLPHCTNTC
jgi:hypothetical protein